MMKLKNGCMNVIEDKKSEKAFVLEVCMKDKLNVIVMKGTATKEPAFGASAFWVSSAKEDDSLRSGRDLKNKN